LKLYVCFLLGESKLCLMLQILGEPLESCGGALSAALSHQAYYGESCSPNEIEQYPEDHKPEINLLMSKLQSINYTIREASLLIDSILDHTLVPLLGVDHGLDSLKFRLGDETVLVGQHEARHDHVEEKPVLEITHSKKRDRSSQSPRLLIIVNQQELIDPVSHNIEHKSIQVENGHA
jgi:hypothetical protein